jgi:hypothetical protein
MKRPSARRLVSKRCASVGLGRAAMPPHTTNNAPAARGCRRRRTTAPLGVTAPRLVPLDAEHERRAIDALAVLLRPLLAGTDTRLKAGAEGTCSGAVPADADAPPTREDERR